MSKKYWEEETPMVLDTKRNEVRFYPEFGKVQVFPKVWNAKRGIGHGATLDIELLSREEVAELKRMLDICLDRQLEKEIE